MSEPDKSFNRSLKDKMEGFQPELPAGVWERIDASLPPPVVSKPNYYKYAALLLLLLLPVAYYIGITKSMHSASSDKEKNTATETNRPNYNLKEIAEASASSEKGKKWGSNDNRNSIGKGNANNGNTPAAVFGEESLGTSSIPNTDIPVKQPIITASQQKAFPPLTVSDSITESIAPIASKSFILEEAESNWPKPKEVGISYFELREDAKEINENSISTGRWFVGVWGGPTLSYRRMESDVHRDVVEHRNAHEQTLLTHHVGMEAGLVWKRWLFSSGIEHFRKGEHYSFQGAVKHEFTNRYTYFSLPVSVGYQLYKRNKLTISPVTGVTVNRLYKAEASWLNPHNHSEVHMSSTHNNPYRVWGLMARAHVNFAWRVLPNVEMQYRAGYSYFVQSIYAPSMQLNQRPFSWDQAIGLRYYLH